MREMQTEKKPQSTTTSNGLLQRNRADNHEPETVPPIVYAALRSPGQPLDTETRAFFEPRFGHDFSKVRVHTDERAAESALAVKSLAYAMGNDIVFGKAQYTRAMNDEHSLLAHELTHVVEQASLGTSTRLQRQAAGAAVAPAAATPSPVSGKSELSGFPRVDAIITAIKKAAKLATENPLDLAAGKEFISIAEESLRALAGPDAVRARFGGQGADVYGKVSLIVGLALGNVSRMKHMTSLYAEHPTRPMQRGGWQACVTSVEAARGYLEDLNGEPQFSEQVPDASQQRKVYEDKLLEAATMINKVPFKRADDPKEPKFDSEYWELSGLIESFKSKRASVRDLRMEPWLKLLPGKHPSEAIDAMFRNLDKWQFDCAQAAQVSQWYAMRHAYGAFKFNKIVQSSGIRFELHEHNSTGIRRKRLYEAGLGDTSMKSKSDGMTENINTLLANAPVGSRIAWTNNAAESSADFRNENALKIGNDKYFSHPYKFRNQKMIKAKLAMETYGVNLSEAQEKTILSNYESDVMDDEVKKFMRYIDKNIFLSEIEIFDLDANRGGIN